MTARTILCVLFPSALAGVTLIDVPAAAQSFTQMVSFGDSLSDTGNVSNATFGISPGSNYFAGRYSNGPVWVEALAGSLSLSAPAPSRRGGRNHAHAGTKTGSGSTTFVFFSFPNAGTQVNQYLSGNVPSASQLFTLYAGANDFLDNLGQNPTTIVNNLVNHVTALNNAGARYVVVPNLPPLGNTPRYNANLSTRDAYNALTANFNAQLASAMTTLDAQLPVKIYQLNVADTFAALLADPSQFGLTNVTQPALVNGTVVANPDQYLFYDDVHPTRIGHRFLASAALDLVSTHDWVGGDGNWGDSARWEVAGVPEPAWIASIDNLSAAPFTVEVAASSQVRQVRVAGTAADAVLRVAAGATLTATQSVALRSGAKLDVDAGASVSTPNLRLSSSAVLGGGGTIHGEVANDAGTVTPGAASTIGTLAVNGGFAQSSSGVLAIDLSGVDGASDRLEVGGVAQLGGTLRLLATPGEVPLPGHVYTVLTHVGGGGSLSIENQTGFSGLRFGLSITPGAVVLELSAFPGDANLDAVVNIADFAALAGGFNQNGNWLDGDFTGDRLVNIADFSLLAGNFNLAAPAGRGWAAAPEPGGVTAGMIVLSITAGRRYRARLVADYH